MQRTFIFIGLPPVRLSKCVDKYFDTYWAHTHTHRLLLCCSMSMTGSERPLLSKAERSHICSLSVRFMSQQQLRLLFPVLSLSAASESAVLSLSLSLCVLSSVNSLTEESCKINFHRLVVQQKKERKSCRRWSKLCVCHFLLIKTYSRCPLKIVSLPLLSWLRWQK